MEIEELKNLYNKSFRKENHRTAEGIRYQLKQLRQRGIYNHHKFTSTYFLKSTILLCLRNLAPAKLTINLLHIL